MNATPASAVGSLEMNDKKVQMFLATIGRTKSIGPDNLFLTLIKNKTLGNKYWSRLPAPLTDQYNCVKSWRQSFGEFTTDFQKEDKTVTLYYRLVRLASVAAKILEIIRDKLLELLEGNSVNFDAQHIFINRFSRLANVLDFFQGIDMKL